MTFVTRVLFVSVSLAAVAACYSNASCPNDFPSCPDAGGPSYVNDVEPIIHDACATCHSPGGSEPAPALDTYAHVFANAQGSRDQILTCKMPLDGPLPIPQRNIVLTWMACGAPNN